MFPRTGEYKKGNWGKDSSTGQAGLEVEKERNQIGGVEQFIVQSLAFTIGRKVEEFPFIKTRKAESNKCSIKHQRKRHKVHVAVNTSGNRDKHQPHFVHTNAPTCPSNKLKTPRHSQLSSVGQVTINSL